MKNEITIKLNAEQQAKFAELKQTREGKSDLELLMQVIDRGLYDICYRSRRNKQQWASFREWKQSQKQ